MGGSPRLHKIIAEFVMYSPMTEGYVRVHRHLNKERRGRYIQD
jgi:hypothetical protein